MKDVNFAPSKYCGRIWEAKRCLSLMTNPLPWGSHEIIVEELEEEVVVDVVGEEIIS